MKTNNSTTSTMDVLQQFILAEKGSPSPPASGQYGDENIQPNAFHGSINNNLERRASLDGRTNDTGGGRIVNETGRGKAGLGKGSARSTESLSKRDARFEKNLDKRRTDGKAGEPKVHKTFFLKSILRGGKSKKSAKDSERTATNWTDQTKVDDPKRFFASNAKSNAFNGTNELNNKDNATNKSTGETKPINQNGNQPQVNDSIRFDATSLKENNGLRLTDIIDNNKYNTESNKYNKYNRDGFERKSSDSSEKVIGKSSTLDGGAGLRQKAFVSREQEFAAKSATLDGRDLGRTAVGDQKPPLSPTRTQETVGRRSRSPAKKGKRIQACRAFTLCFVRI